MNILEFLSPAADGLEIELVEVRGPLGICGWVDLQQTDRSGFGRGQAEEAVEYLPGGIVDQSGVTALHEVFEEEESIEFELWKHFGVFDEHFEVVYNVTFEVTGEATDDQRPALLG